MELRLRLEGPDKPSDNLMVVPICLGVIEHAIRSLAAAADDFDDGGDDDPPPSGAESRSPGEGGGSPGGQGGEESQPAHPWATMPAEAMLQLRDQVLCLPPFPPFHSTMSRCCVTLSCHFCYV